MKEREIMEIAKARLIAGGWVYWIPPRTWGERDIFGVFDFAAIKDKRLIFVQITTIQHISDRRKKIQNFYRENNIGPLPNVFIWAYNPKKAVFKTEKVI